MGGMRSTLLLFSVIAIGFPSCRSNGSSTAEVREVIDAQQAAWNRGDVEGFLRLGYWDSPELTFFSVGEVERGFRPMLERFLARYRAGDAESGKLTFTDVVVTPIEDDHAFVRGHWYVDFEKKEDQGGLFTLVFERRSEGWRIVHDHTSIATPGPAKVQ